MLLLQGDTEAAKAFVGNDAEILNNTLYRIKRAIANNPIDAATPQSKTTGADMKKAGRIFSQNLSANFLK